MGALETRLRKEIIDLAHTRYGMVLFKNVVGRAKMQGGWVTLGMGIGTPDLLGYLPLYDHLNKAPFALFTGIELKCDQDRLSNKQMEVQTELEKDGCLIFTVSSSLEFKTIVDHFLSSVERHGFQKYKAELN